MNSPIYCAYNQTRECFLGLEVTAVDWPREDIGEAIRTLALKSGEGLWIAPFQGIPPAGFSAPLDLIYLDHACRVLDLVESSSEFHLSASSPQPASLLALPPYSIYVSQTEVGDRLLVCVPEEMQRRFDLLAVGSAPESLHGAMLLQEEPSPNEGRGIVGEGRDIVENQNHACGNPGSGQLQLHAMDPLKAGSQGSYAPRNWLERWLRPDPRKAPREPTPGLAAYYWTGAAPRPHRVRDVSSSGLYLVTEDRWYPGTLVLMTLQKMPFKEEAAERSIAVQSCAVRWGQDGVGLHLELPDARDVRLGRVPVLGGVGKKEFDRFLQQIRRDK